LTLDSLYRQEAESLRRHAARRLSDPNEAEDVVNEAFRILADRGLDNLRNPGAFLTRVVDNLVAASLRLVYERRAMIDENANESFFPASKDTAEVFASEERDRLVNLALTRVPSPRHRRILKLFSLGYKPAEIAKMETAAGKVSTSHQISCALIQARKNLEIEFRRKGLPAVIFALEPLGRLKLRFKLRRARVYELLARIDISPAIHFAIASVLTAIATVSIMRLDHDAQPGASTAHSAGLQEVLAPTELANRDPLRSPATNDRSARLSVASFDALGFQHELRNRKESNEGEPAPSLPEQLMTIIEDPDEIPVPECGGLPICGNGG
jgi:DNA-directed RNA polymerase specialized sigma24 family protein